MIKVGLTGGYATGKSFVAAQLERLGCKVIYADRLGHQVLQPDGEAYEPVIKEFGKGILKGLEIDRKQLALHVFGIEGRLEVLTDIVHPAVFRLENKILEQWQHESPNGVAVVEAAILVETGRYADFNFVILTHCDQAVQIERGMRRDHLTRDEVLARISRQLPFEEKKKHADFVIDTGGSKDQTAVRVEHAYADILRGGKEISAGSVT